METNPNDLAEAMDRYRDRFDGLPFILWVMREGRADAAARLLNQACDRDEEWTDDAFNIALGFGSVGMKPGKIVD